MKQLELTRRRFLATAAVAVSAPLLVSPRALGRDGFSSPSETVNLGLIGLGTRGPDIRAFTENDNPVCRLCAGCDVDTRKFGAIGKEKKYFQYYEEMFQLPELDAVYIAAPDHWHTRMTIDACKAGLDVYCEKPLTFSLMESRQIVAAARKYDRVVMSGSQRVMEDYGHIMAPIIQSGAIGEVKEIYAECAGAPSERTYDPVPCPPELDWDRWVGQAPYMPYSPRAIQPMTWRFNTAFGTGGLGDWGGHNFGGALYSCGMDHIAPKEVYAPNTDRNPFRGAMIIMENGVKFFHGCDDGTIKIVGTEGTYILGKTPEIKARHAVDLRRYHGGAQTLCEDFVYCVKNRLRPFQDVFYGANVSDYGHLCILAYILNRDLVWDKEKMEFVGDREATTMVSKVQRAPYQIEL